MLVTLVTPLLLFSPALAPHYAITPPFRHFCRHFTMIRLRRHTLSLFAITRWCYCQPLRALLLRLLRHTTLYYYYDTPYHATHYVIRLAFSIIIFIIIITIAERRVLLISHYITHYGFHWCHFIVSFYYAPFSPRMLWYRHTCWYWLPLLPCHYATRYALSSLYAIISPSLLILLLRYDGWWLAAYATTGHYAITFIDSHYAAHTAAMPFSARYWLPATIIHYAAILFQLQIFRCWPRWLLPYDAIFAAIAPHYFRLLLMNNRLGFFPPRHTLRCHYYYASWQLLPLIAYWHYIRHSWWYNIIAAGHFRHYDADDVFAIVSWYFALIIARCLRWLMSLPLMLCRPAPLRRWLMHYATPCAATWCHYWLLLLMPLAAVVALLSISSPLSPGCYFFMERQFRVSAIAVIADWWGWCLITPLIISQLIDCQPLAAIRHCLSRPLAGFFVILHCISIAAATIILRYWYTEDIAVIGLILPQAGWLHMSPAACRGWWLISPLILPLRWLITPLPPPLMLISCIAGRCQLRRGRCRWACQRCCRDSAIDVGCCWLLRLAFRFRHACWWLLPHASDTDAIDTLDYADIFVFAIDADITPCWYWAPVIDAMIAMLDYADMPGYACCWLIGTLLRCLLAWYWCRFATARHELATLLILMYYATLRHYYFTLIYSFRHYFHDFRHQLFRLR